MCKVARKLTLKPDDNGGEHALCDHCGEVVFREKDFANRQQLGAILLVISAVSLVAAIVAGNVLPGGWALAAGVLSFGFFTFGMAARDRKTLVAMHERGPR